MQTRDLLMPSVILLAMVFFGWLAWHAPPGLPRLILPPAAMLSIAVMFAFMARRRFR